MSVLVCMDSPFYHYNSSLDGSLPLYVPNYVPKYVPKLYLMYLMYLTFRYNCLDLGWFEQFYQKISIKTANLLIFSHFCHTF